MCRKLMYVASFVVPVLSLIDNAQAVEPIADAYVRGATNGDTNYGSDASLLIKNNSGGANDRKVYTRFDIAGMAMGASLDLTVSTNNEGGGGTTPQTFTVEVYGLAESLDHTWTENDITWNNAPANNTSNHDFTADATKLGSFIVDQLPAGETISFSDPNLVDFINSDTDNQITLMLRRTTGNGSHNLGFASREHASYSAPALSVEVATQAFRPDPADGALIEATWASLSWRAIDSAVSHDVYIGDNFDDVKDGFGDSFQVNQTGTTLLVGFPGFPIPGGLIPGTTYYWRIDEVNDADPNSPRKGSIWSFSIPPKTASSPVPADGAESVAMDARLVWAPGFEAKLHAVYFGDDFNDVNSAAGGLLGGDTFFTPPGPLELAKTYYWRVDEFDPPNTYKGAVWSFRTEGTAADPIPAKSAVDVSPTPILNWTAASLAASHEVYFGADADAVTNAGKSSPEYKGAKSLGEEMYDAGRLDLQTTYYWRVDEVNDTQPGSPWIGNVWSFTTGDFLVADDFEAYNDLDPPDPASNRIFDKWIDGFGTLTNGALVGNDLPPYAEQTVVHGGAQSMIYRYDNAGKTSEATLTLVYPRDWTEQGVTKLILWCRGTSANAADRMFVALNGTSVVYHADASATQITGWNQWVIDLQAFAGVNLANVNTITIGIGTKNAPSPGGGAGTMYFDDIRLIR